MRYLLLLLLVTNIYANVKEEMFTLYQNKKFKEACRLGFKNFSNFKKDESFVSLYGFSCLNADYIDRLAIPITSLKHSQEARANAAYFSVILMQKKLLYHALIDNYDLSELKLPTTDYILSKVFDLYTQIQLDKKRSYYIFKDPDNPKISYKLYIVKEDYIVKMVIEEFYDTMMTKRHLYW
ncbi:MAG: hypothetical protein GXO11_04715 [Epsilonproteobacteria bacterium]|nr:hypothetical protein [Campylobacterota bacterium]